MMLRHVLEGEVYEQSLALGFVMSLMTGLADSEASVVGLCCVVEVCESGSSRPASLGF